MSRRRRKARAERKEREQKPAQSLLDLQDLFPMALPAPSPEAISNATALSSTSRDADPAAMGNFF